MFKLGFFPFSRVPKIYDTGLTGYRLMLLLYTRVS